MKPRHNQQNFREAPGEGNMVPPHPFISYLVTRAGGAPCKSRCVKPAMSPGSVVRVRGDGKDG
jgi:hypothetical protein